MSLASAYASSIATAQSSAPTSFVGPKITASVSESGDCLINFNGTQFLVPAANALSFASWITTTFT